MSRSSNIKKAITTTIIISIVILGGIFYFVILPQIEKIIQTKENIETQREALEKRYIQGQNLKELAENIDIVENNLDNLEEIYVEEEEALEFITALENISETNNIAQKINLSSLDEGKKILAGYYERGLQISISGYYSDFISYLRDMEMLKYYININSIDINSQVLRTKSEGGEPPVNIIINSTIFWKITEKDA